MSTLSAFPFIGEQSFATPGAFNSPLSIISANIAAVNAAAGSVSGVTITPPSGNTITIASDLSVLGTIAAGPAWLGVNSNVTNYLFLSDTSHARSDYIIGSQVGGTADGLNIWDASGSTMIVSFSKQSIRFFQQVVGPVFDVGGALSDTLNAATFGTGSDSKESRIQAAISAASLTGISRVYVPANMYPYSAGSVSFDTRVQMVREGGNWDVHDVRAYGAAGNAVADDTAAIRAAVVNASLALAAPPDGVTGTAYVPPGIYLTSSQLTIPAKTRLIGAGRSGSVIRAGASFPVSTAMFALGNGVNLAFGSRLENLTIDCNDIAGSIGVQARETHEQSGLIGVVVTKYRQYGFDSNNNGGTGSAQTFIHYCEFYGSSLGSIVGIYLVGGSGTQYTITATTASGAAASPATSGIQIEKGSLIAIAVHFEGATNGIYFNGATGTTRGFVQGAVGNTTCTNVIRIAAGVNSTSAVLFVIQDNGSAVTVLDERTGRTLTGGISWYLLAEGPTSTTGRYVLSSDQDSGGVATPTALGAGSNDDFAFAGSSALAKMRTARISGSGGGSTLTGLAGGVNGTRLELINVSAIAITLSHEDTASAAGNRLTSGTGASIILNQNDVAIIEYDGTSARWRILTALT